MNSADTDRHRCSQFLCGFPAEILLQAPSPDDVRMWVILFVDKLAVQRFDRDFVRLFHLRNFSKIPDWPIGQDGG